MLPNELVYDLVADVLSAPSLMAAQDLLAGLDRVTAARVGGALAVLVRADRRRLPSLVARLRGKAASSRDVSALEELWRLPAAEAGGPDGA